MSKNLLVYVFSILLISVVACKKEPEVVVQTSLTGIVKNEMQENVIFPVFIFLDDELLATTDSTGSFKIITLEAGTYNITYSAVGYSDKKVNINITEGKVTNVNISMTPNNEIGRVYGEFQDGNLYDEMLISFPSLSGWDDKEVYEGVSGATLQEKTLLHEIGDITVYLGDSLVAYTDGFGQYWFKVQCGTYPVTGKCQGYKNKQQTVVVKPDDKIYLNFIMEND